MRIAVIDDEETAVRGLVYLLRELEPASEVAGFCRWREALPFLREHPCDVVFLDVQMPKRNGIELAAEIRKMCPRSNIIFETGYSTYGLEAIRLHASGYITKPVTKEKPLYKDWDEFVPNAAKMMERIHSTGAKLFMQLGSGRGRVLYAHRPMPGPEGPTIFEKALIAPSEVSNVWRPKTIHRAMTTKEVEDLIYNFGQAAKMAKAANIDGVEVHAVHEGYLLDQFTIENLNHRTDRFGGSLENRMRLAKEIIEEIHKQCGDDYPVMVRYSVVSKMRGLNQGALPGEAYREFGRSLEESPKVAQMLEEYGYVALDADNGSYDAWYWPHPPVYMPHGCNLPEVEFIKHYVNIPVICGGRMDDFDLSADALNTGRIDAVAIARQFLADPEWPNKLREGRIEDIRPCIACHSGCFGGTFGKEGRPLGCAVNATVLRERETAITPAEKKKTIVIIGGGMAGMEYARVAALRGHRCVIFEKTGALGGVFIAASQHDYKDSDRRLIAWFRRQMELLHIDVRLNTEATREAVLAEKPDYIVAATGSKPKRIPVAGAELAMDATDALMHDEAIGKNVAVIGGGLTGCEIAFDLGKKGKTVTLVEMQDDILQVQGLSPANEMMLRELLRYHKVRVMTSHHLKEIVPEDAWIEKNDGRLLEMIPADTVILAAGYDPYLPEVVEQVRDIAPVKILGDADHVGNILSAINDAYMAALTV